MSKSKKFKNLNLAQKLLEDGSLTSNTLFEETKGTDTVLTWVIRDYSKLKQSVRYHVSARKYSRIWYLMLHRKNFQLFAHVSTDAVIDNIAIFFLKNNGEVLDSVLNTSVPNAYSAILDEKQICSPTGKLIDDLLIIQCMYTARPYESTIFLTPGLQECNELREISDVNILFNDLKKLYLTGRFSDFILRVGVVEFKVHKLILRRHSNYLARRLTEDPDWTGKDLNIKAAACMMHEVLLYLYSGEMRNLQLDGMIEVYVIAWTLEIASLQTICVHYFKSMFSIHLISDFFELARRHKHLDFQKEIMHFLNKQPQSVRQTKVWADVIAKVSNSMEDERQI